MTVAELTEYLIEEELIFPKEQVLA